MNISPSELAVLIGWADKSLKDCTGLHSAQRDIMLAPANLYLANIQIRKLSRTVKAMQRVVDAAVAFQAFQDAEIEKEIERGTFTREQLDETGEAPVFTELREAVKAL